jgi:large subunit ribosomal protein L16
MLLSPKNRKFRKDRKGGKGKIATITYTGCNLDKGNYGLKSLSPGRVTAAQIDAVRVVLRRAMKKEGKIFIRIFPFTPITKKPAEVRMGGGKGSPEYWVAKVEPGRIMFEIDGVTEEIAKEAMRLAAFKLSLETKFVKRII